MFKIKKHKSLVKIFLSLFLTLSSSICTGLLCLPLKDYKMDKIAFSLNNYNKFDYYNDFVNPILKIHQDSKDPEYSNRYELYNDVFEEYYYNSFPKCIRQVLNNDLEIYNTKVKMFCQRTYSVSNSFLDDGSHYVDYGLFSAYFADDILGPRQYLYERFNCSSFIYISDKFADLLLEKYQINSYEELIKKEEYCILPLFVDGKETYNVCINNILYSNSREAWRVKELYGDYFALINVSKYNGTKKFADVSLEFDLKVDPFGMKRIFKGLSSYGYTTDNTDYEFYTFDRSVNKYIFNEKISNDFMNIKSNNIISIVIVFITLFSICFAFFIKLINLSSSETKYLFGIYVVLLIVFGLVSSFTYIYILWFVLPLIHIFTYLCLSGILSFRKRKIYNEINI